MPSKVDISIFWFRRDLRLHDNTVLPIFIFDTNVLDKLTDKVDARIQFILNQVITLKQQLEEHESTLKIFHSNPESAFRQLDQEYNVREVFTNRDYEPSAIERDRKISDLLKAQKIPFHHFKDHVVFEGNEVLKQDGTPFKVFSPYKRVWMQKLAEDCKKCSIMHCDLTSWR